MKNTAINISTKKPLQTVKDPVTRVSIHCTAKDEKGADVEVNILDLEQHHTTNEIKLTFGGSPSQALTMLSRVMVVLQQQASRKNCNGIPAPVCSEHRKEQWHDVMDRTWIYNFKGLSAGTNYVKAINLCE